MSIGNSPEDDRTFPADDRDSIGRALQQARIAAGLTVEEVSASTRVRIPIVQAIEEDDFSRCGGDVYARGHIRTLARAVGLDPATLIEQYDAEHGGRPAPTPAAPLFEGPHGRCPVQLHRRLPGETEADFAELERFITHARLDAIGVFGYSDEDGTEAATYEHKLDQDVVDERLAHLSRLAEELTAQRAEERIGETLEVLVESESDDEDEEGGWIGRAAHQAPETDGQVLLLTTDGGAGPGLAPGLYGQGEGRRHGGRRPRGRVSFRGGGQMTGVPASATGGPVGRRPAASWARRPSTRPACGTSRTSSP
ncbi:tRNA-2-methylthio-N(6)-dimethylallyladenosine synthase [Streptomyces tanashiensis]